MLKFLRGARRVVLMMSLMLFVLIAVAAVKSYLQADYVVWAWTKEHHLESVHGTVHYWTTVCRRWYPDKPPEYFPPQHDLDGPDKESRPYRVWPAWGRTSFRNWGFADRGRFFGGVSYSEFVELGPPAISYLDTHLAIPYWMPLALTGGGPALWLIWKFTRRRPKPGCCGKCGYDLRAHAAGARCPECGTQWKGANPSIPASA